MTASASGSSFAAPAPSPHNVLRRVGQQVGDPAFEVADVPADADRFPPGAQRGLRPALRAREMPGARQAGARGSFQVPT